jgi:hypothetical protein
VVAILEVSLCSEPGEPFSFSSYVSETALSFVSVASAVVTALFMRPSLKRRWLGQRNKIAEKVASA